MYFITFLYIALINKKHTQYFYYIYKLAVRLKTTKHRQWKKIKKWKKYQDFQLANLNTV